MPDYNGQDGAGLRYEKEGEKFPNLEQFDMMKWGRKPQIPQAQPNQVQQPQQQGHHI